MNIERKNDLLQKIRNELTQDTTNLSSYLNSLVLKRNRTSLMMNSFMHNVVDI